MRITLAALLAAGTLVVGGLGAPPADARTPMITTSYMARRATMPEPATGTLTAASRQGQGKDLPDAVSGRQTHAIYFVPKDRVDERLDLGRGLIPRTLSGVGAWFRAQMGTAPRFDLTSRGTHDITFVRGRLRAGAYRSLDSIVDEIRSRGFDVPTKRYIVFATVARGATCGESQYPLAPAPAVGRYLAVYLDSAKECRVREAGRGTAATAGYAEATVAHEWLHTEGVVPTLAPRHCAGHAYHTCTGSLWLFPAMDPESRDVMFPYAGVPLRHKELDRGRDDYLDQALPHVRDLRTSPFLA
jgi:hypothetical protein